MQHIITHLRGTEQVAFLPFSCEGANWASALATVAMPWRPAKATCSFCDRPLKHRTTSPSVRSRGASWLLGQGDSPHASTCLLSSRTSFCSRAFWSGGSLDRSAFEGGPTSRAFTLHGEGSSTATHASCTVGCAVCTDLYTAHTH